MASTKAESNSLCTVPLLWARPGLCGCRFAHQHTPDQENDEAFHVRSFCGIRAGRTVVQDCGRGDLPRRKTCQGTRRPNRGQPSPGEAEVCGGLSFFCSNGQTFYRYWMLQSDKFNMREMKGMALGFAGCRKMVSTEIIVDFFPTIEYLLSVRSSSDLCPARKSCVRVVGPWLFTVRNSPFIL